MASYRKVKTGWRVEVCVEGKRASTTRTTKAEARAWAERREEELRRGWGVVSGTVADLFDRYAREVSPTKRGERWEVVRLKAMARLPLGSVPLSKVGVEDLVAWRDARLREVSAGAVLRDMNLLSHVFEVARREWKWLSENPMKDVARPKSPRPRTRLPTQDEIERITLSLGYVDGDPMTTKQQRVAVAYLFALETAMRAGEICGIRPEDIEGRVVHLPMTKNGEARDVPLSARALELLEQLKPWGATVFQLSPGTLDVLFRRARDNCQISGLRFHDSRAEATGRLSKKLDVLQLARVTGHKDLRMLMVYYRESVADLAERL